MVFSLKINQNFKGHGQNGKWTHLVARPVGRENRFHIASVWQGSKFHYSIIHNFQFIFKFDPAAFAVIFMIWFVNLRIFEPLCLADDEMLADDCPGVSTKVEKCGPPCSTEIPKNITQPVTNTTGIIENIEETDSSSLDTGNSTDNANESGLIPTEPGIPPTKQGKVNHKELKTAFITRGMFWSNIKIFLLSRTWMNW